uniref:Uncharacterized protein n=1 Tax=Ciona savignyi TaxID=51511 RepID=H2YI60_CIOSA
MRFLQTASQSMSKITFHHYYMNGRTATVDDFTNPKTLGGLAKQIQQMVDVQQQWAPGTSVWIGETASAYGGGAKGISNSYVDGITWLDKLGMSSKMGVEMVIRQTFLESNYALIDTNFDPLPDYWLTLLYKRLVGNKVLNATASKCRKGQCFAFGKGSVRIYAHCAKEKFKRGSVVLYFINLWPRRLHLSFHLPENSIGYMYLLKPGESGNLTSTSVRLNGKVLRLTSSNSIPPLPPKRIEQSKLRRALSVPSLTFGFLVLEGVNARACMDGK